MATVTPAPVAAGRVTHEVWPGQPYPLGATYDGDARTSIQLIGGAARLEAAGRSAELRSGQVAAIDQGQPWNLTAAEDSAVLVTFAWPRDRAGV